MNHFLAGRSDRMFTVNATNIGFYKQAERLFVLNILKEVNHWTVWHIMHPVYDLHLVCVSCYDAS